MDALSNHTSAAHVVTVIAFELLSIFFGPDPREHSSEQSRPLLGCCLISSAASFYDKKNIGRV